MVKTKKGGDVLYGELTYINVPAARKHISSLFVHPTTLERYGKIESVHCEIWSKGKIRAMIDYPKRSPRKWWEKKAPIKGVLLTKFYTPFAYEGEYDGLAIKVE